jgi:hypothetical protein
VCALRCANVDVACPAGTTCTCDDAP